PHGDEALRGMDPLSDRSTAKRVLDLLREAHAAAQQAKVKLTTRAVPRIVNQYPSLIETPDEAWMLPLSAKHFSHVATNTVRNDLTIRDKVAVDDLYKRIERLRSQGRPKSEISYHPLLPKLSDDVEQRFREPLAFLRATQQRAFCEYPFTRLYLDTYRTYVCCQATDRFLYGHRYESGWPRLYDIWNSAFLREARQAMYDNKFEKVCHSRCFYFASGGSYETLDRLLQPVKGEECSRHPDTAQRDPTAWLGM